MTSDHRGHFRDIEVLFLLVVAGLGLGLRGCWLGLLRGGFVWLLRLALLRLLFLGLLLSLLGLFLRLVRLRTGLIVLLRGGEENEEQNQRKEGDQSAHVGSGTGNRTNRRLYDVAKMEACPPQASERPHPRSRFCKRRHCRVFHGWCTDSARGKAGPLGCMAREV